MGENNTEGVDIRERELAARGYSLRFLLGQGATSAVYCVKEVKSGKNYACKAGVRKEWLAEEYELLSCQHHPLFPGAVEFWQGEAEGFLVMEYLDGCCLEDCLKRRGHFSQREAVRIAMELADGLGSLHNGGIPAVYRDLKPSNIMIRPDGSARLMDLGAVKRLEGSICVPKGQQTAGAGMVSYRAGTPGFSAPEQFEAGAEVDIRADIYALGKVLLSMLGGCDPVSGQVGNKGRRVPVAGGLRGVTDSCLQRDPAFRIPDMGEVLRRLRCCLDSSGGRICRGRTSAVWGGRRTERIRYEKNILKSSHQTDITAQ